ncbi:hypothetical protein UNDYM_1664 [Undibacterium sp. YM2]|uniref:hypothetical protein n=1 Tax=Undibacterium sp. YM2 TaxID=2058625 RepID=UPI001331DDB9|nr:hypothetical protein [Undibacterium sp. YM2]BBB65917.1 hypothetical protein UNDYM_1664 [Undibacterium sp. YM2]
MSDGLMKLIKPVTITTAMLTSTTVAEPDTGETAWVSGHAYVIGNEVIVVAQHRKYICIANITGIVSPELDLTHWQDIGPTNAWAMFDRAIGTSTEDASPLTVVLEPGTIGGLAMLECVGRQAQVTYKDASGGTTVYSKTVSLDGTIIGSVYDWFFEEYEQLGDFVLTDLPPQYPNGELTVSITATAGDVSCGVLSVGRVIEFGKTLDGAKATIDDYSIKETNEYGATDVVERTYNRRSSFDVVIDSADFNRLYRRLSQLRAIPCVYIGVDELGYQPFINYGFFETFGMVVSYGTKSLCNLEIKGLT